MSCAPGKPCEEGRKRHMAIIVLFVMVAIFAALSIFSFLNSRNQVLPNAVKYGEFNAVQGKRVFQSYNCMGCHTIVGNGAYFAPDLTKLYGKVGPAWLAAFLPSAGGWPTGAAVRTQLQNPMLAKESGATTLEEYFKLYPGAAERVERRGGHASLMPNLPLKADEIGHLTAFLKYTSEMNNEGWPPVPKIDGLATKYATPTPKALAAVAASAVGATPTATPAPVAEDPAVVGKKVANEYGCMACHATDQKRLVGP
ncbi:MAG: c-type cytochrome, partial [Herbaspirillum sp.]